MHIRDTLYRNHDKDDRCFQVFPSALLANRSVHVWRVSHWGSLDIDVLRPRVCNDDLPPLVVVIHRPPPYMRVAVPPPTKSPMELLQEWSSRGETIRECLAGGVAGLHQPRGTG